MEAEPFGHADVVVGHLDPTAVGAAEADQDLGLRADFLGAGEVATGLGVGHERVGIALDDEGRGRLVADPVERRELAAGAFALARSNASAAAVYFSSWRRRIPRR